MASRGNRGSGTSSRNNARSARSKQIARSKAIQKNIAQREFNYGALAGLIAAQVTAQPTVQPVSPPVNEPIVVDIDYRRLAKEITRELWGEDPPGTLMGIRQIIKQQRADRDLDQETRQFLVETANKLDRVLGFLEDDAG